MTALLLEHASWAVGASTDRRTAVAGAGRSWVPASGGLTLDELITGVWEGLSAGQTVRCPACGGAMAPASEPGPRRAAGACGDCASRLG